MTATLDPYRALVEAGSDVDDPTAERARLLAAIEAARERTAAARRRIEQLDRSRRATVMTAFAAAVQELAALEQRHRDQVAELRAAATTQAAHILADARRRVGGATDPIWESFDGSASSR